MDIVLQLTFIFNAMFIKKKKVSRTISLSNVFAYLNIDKFFYVINSYLFTRVVRQTSDWISKMINISLILLLLLLINYQKNLQKNLLRNLKN